MNERNNDQYYLSCKQELEKIGHQYKKTTISKNNIMIYTKLYIEKNQNNLKLIKKQKQNDF